MALDAWGVSKFKESNAPPLDEWSILSIIGSEGYPNCDINSSEDDIVVWDGDCDDVGVYVMGDACGCNGGVLGDVGERGVYVLGDVRDGGVYVFDGREVWGGVNVWDGVRCGDVCAGGV